MQPIPTGSVEFRDYLVVLRRRFALIAIVTLLSTATAAAYSLGRTPIYESTASVLVRAITTNAFDPGQRVDQQLNMFNQRQLAESEPVAMLAAKYLGTHAAPEQLLRHVAVDVPANSQIIKIHYSDPVPLTAQRGANAFAKAYLKFRQTDAERQAKTSRVGLQSESDKVRQELAQAQKTASDPDAPESVQRTATVKIQQLNARLEKLEDQINAFRGLDFTPGTLIASANLPTAPASPKHTLNVGIGLLVGLFLGVALAFIRDRTDTRLRGREDLAERLDRPVLATIPPFPKWIRQEGQLLWKRRKENSLVILEQPGSLAAESYRTLRTHLARLASQLDIKSVMVVSAGVGEGKSSTTANLAVALAETGKDVLLVSADLRRPRIHHFFGVSNKSGLSNLLTDGSASDGHQGSVPNGKQIASELWSMLPSLWVVLSGPTPPHPSALMDSDAMRQFLKFQRDQFDFIILDCPPALVVADALALAPLVDAVLVVADATKTDRKAVTRLRAELEQVDGKIVGAVLNRSKQASKNAYYYQPDE
jgi:polysaccharide biosynthesis transport protein